MKENKVKGFTLIELLAVIVILAIIALIATPIVLSIISDSKESSGLRSAEMYLDAVEQSISLEKMNNTNFNPNNCRITDKGNLYCDEDESNIIEVEVNGETPINGSVTFEEGKITDISLVYNNDKVIVKDEDGNLVYGDFVSEEEETLAPGLYDAEGNMTYSWQELIDGEYLFVDNGVLYADFGSANDDCYHSYDYNHHANKGTMKSLAGKLVIDDSVTSIGGCAFGCYNCGIGCNNLTSIIIPDSVTSIDRDAFSCCENLVSIEISNSITSIGTVAVAGCYSLISINYIGTKEQWNAIALNSSWNNCNQAITVHCTDGTITFSETL